VGWFGKRFERHRRGRRVSSSSRVPTPAPRRRSRICRFEQVEPRQLLSANPIHVGAVYLEEATSQDEAGDVIEITWLGGAPGTELAELTIDTDKDGDGLTRGDAFFDTEPGGGGVFGSVGLSIVQADGIDSVHPTLIDGGTKLRITFTGFDPGEKLYLSVDVDEQGYENASALTEGDEFAGSILSATFTAPHCYEAAGSDIFRDYYDDKLDDEKLKGHLPPDNYGEVPRPVETAGAMFSLTQTPLPISIAGTVFEDLDLDNRQDAGEPGLDDVTLELYHWVDGGYAATGRTTVTDTHGDYRFDELLPGTYRVVESQPQPYLSVGASAGTVDGQTRGAVLSPDVIGRIELRGGDDSVDNDFAEAQPVRLSGHVYHDADNDGVMDPGEAGIRDVLVRVTDRSTPAGPGSPTDAIEVTTDPYGYWEVSGLYPGGFWVEEVQPGGYLDGLDAPGSPEGVAHNPGDRIDGFRLEGGQSGRNYDFGELVASSISGRVIADANGNCSYDPGDSLLANVTLYLLDGSGKRINSTTADAQGEYAFTGLTPGVYGVEEIQPEGYYDGADHVGSEDGTLAPPDSIVAITLVSGTAATRYDFCELEPASLSGFVYVDENNNGVRDSSEPGIPNVQLKLLDKHGTPTGITTNTDASGFYRFDDLQPQTTYGVAEVQPAGYYDGLDKEGTAGGSAEYPGDKITGALLQAGFHAENYNFGELRPASLSGFVYVDDNQNDARDAGEAGIPKVQLKLLDKHGTPTGITTTTDALGFYRFDDLPPETTYGVAEVQPSEYYDGHDTEGTAGGSAQNPGDTITGALLLPGFHAENYNFGELRPASLSGFVYVDDNQNGVRNGGEAGISGVQLKLLDKHGTPTGITATTDASGFYRFDDLQPQTIYGVAEVQPAGYYDGLDKEGTAGGSAEYPGDKITGALLPPGFHAENYNFGELRPASISGRVHAELNGDCTPDPGEPLLAGVTIYLLDMWGDQIDVTTTDENGRYIFRDLEPGTYGVEEVQPPGYFDGPDHVGSAGGALDGNDRIIGAKLISGTEAVEYNFCEVVPASISGYVFQDGPTIRVSPFSQPPDPADVRDGVRTPDDTPIAGVVVRLGDATGRPILDAQGRPRIAVTDARGFYQFNNLEPGYYTVFEDQPDGYVDAIDTPGSEGGTAVNPHEPLDPLALAQLTVDPNDDAIIGIRLAPGDRAESYNFSEVVVVDLPYIIPPPPSPPPTPEPPPAVPVVPVSPKAAAPRYVPSPGVELPPMYGGGDVAMVAFTWHLSVVNAGQPRQDDDDQRTAARDGVEYSAASWTETKMDRSEWVVTDEESRPVIRFRFGTEGGIPLTGDFNGDGVTEVAVFLDGVWFIDLNGNGVWDEGDLWIKLGAEGDLPITGDWDGDGKTDIGIFGPAWKGDARAIAAEPGLPDSDNQWTGRPKNLPPEPQEATVGFRTMRRTVQGELRADLIDHVFQYGSAGDVPIAGDWNGDGVTNIGLFRAGTWFLDADGNGEWSLGDVYVENLGARGDVPVVGDFNGDGVDDLGVYRSGVWHVDTDGDRALTAFDKIFELGTAADKPIVGDFNGDGVDQAGIYRDAAAPPEQQAANPRGDTATR